MTRAAARALTANVVAAFAALLLATCSKDAPPPPAAPPPATPEAPPAEAAAGGGTPAGDTAAAGTADEAPGIPKLRRFRDVPAPPMEGDKAPIAVYDRLRRIAGSGDLDALTRHFSRPSRRMLSRFEDDQLHRLFSGTSVSAERNGGRAVVTLEGSPWTKYAVFVWRGGHWLYDIMLSLKYRPWAPEPEDPEDRPPTLAEATVGLGDASETLAAEIETTHGTLYCRLFEQRAPRTVANFVALARGLRAFRDPETKAWVKRPFYDGTVFHRCVPGFMIQGGDPTGSGSGGPGYAIPDELDLELRHDRGGVLSMANAGPNTAGSQFFVTESATPWLDDRHAIFGDCADPQVAAQIARLNKRPGSDRPLDDVVVEAIRVYRVKEPSEEGR